MPGILSVDEITDSTGTRPVNCPNGITATELVSNTWKNSDGTENYKCRAWVNFDGATTPPTIRASGNVSSVVRNGVGDYTVNFTTPMQDANYAVAGILGHNDALTTLRVVQERKDLSTSSSARIYTMFNNVSANGFIGWLYNSISFFR